MISLRKACLIALVLSCAGAEESCSSDAEAVLPREGRQLLQASIKPASIKRVLTEAAVEVSDGVNAAAGVDRELGLLTKKARDLTGAGRPPSAEEMTVFEAMKKTLTESTLPGITASHKADQALLDNAATAFTQCNAVLATDHDSKLQDDRAALVAAIKEYTDTSLAKATLMTSQSAKTADLQEFLRNNARPACGADTAEPSEALYQEVVKMKSFADGYAERWLSKVAADKTVADNEGTLALAKQSVQIRHCGYQSLFRTASFDYNSCWARAEEDFKTTKDTVTAHNPVLKAHLRSTSMIECLLKVLMAAGSIDTAPAAGAVQECAQMQIHTSALELAVPAIGEKRSLASYAVPESPVDVPCEGEGGDATDTSTGASGEVDLTKAVCTWAAKKPTGFNKEAGLHSVSGGSANGMTDGLLWDDRREWRGCVHTNNHRTNPFVYVDLQQGVRITKVRIATVGAYTLTWSKGAQIVVSDTPFDSPADFAAGKLCTEIPDGFLTEKAWQPDYACDHPVDGRYVGFIVPGERKIVAFSEFEVCGVALE